MLLRWGQWGCQDRIEWLRERTCGKSGKIEMVACVKGQTNRAFDQWVVKQGYCKKRREEPREGRWMNEMDCVEWWKYESSRKGCIINKPGWVKTRWRSGDSVKSKWVLFPASSKLEICVFNREIVYLILKSWDSISWEMRAIFWDKLWCVGQIALRWQNVWFCDLNQHWYALNCVSGYIRVCVHIWTVEVTKNQAS